MPLLQAKCIQMLMILCRSPLKGDEHGVHVPEQGGTHGGWMQRIHWWIILDRPQSLHAEKVIYTTSLDRLTDIAGNIGKTG
jgi:hypothetical protein